MYNADTKRDYLLTIEKNKNLKNIVSFFNSISEMEAALDKDIALFTREEIALYFERFELCNIATVKTKIGYIRGYKLWYNDYVERCVVRVSSEEIISVIDFKTMYQRCLFYSLDEVIAAVDRDLHGIGQPYAPMYILAWFGLERNECYKIKKADMSMALNGSLRIKADNRIVAIDHPRAVEILTEYANTTSFCKAPKRGRTHYAHNDVYLFRKFSTTVPDDGLAKPATDGIFMPLRAGYDRTPEGKRITTNNIKLSGEMFRLLEADAAGADIVQVMKTENPGIDPGAVQTRKEIFELYKKYR